MQLLYPERWNKHEDVDNDIEEAEEDPKELPNDYKSDRKESEYNEVVREYTKIDNSALYLKKLDESGSKIKSDRITYKELLKFFEDDEFLEGYLDSVKTSLRTNLNFYITRKNNIRKELSSQKDDNSMITALKTDTRLEMLNIELKSLTDVIASVRTRLKSIDLNKLKENFNNIIHNKRGFACIVGRDDIKDYIAGQIYSFYKNPKVFLSNSQGIVLTGNSGVGKTRIAKAIAYIYSNSYILDRDNIVEKTPKDITSHYVNEDKKMTFKSLLSSLGGVFFLDEAYGVSGTGISLDRGHGEGSITEMVSFDTTYEGRYVPILAGYDREMQLFMDSNQGLARRYPNKFLLEDYTSSQLTDILINTMNRTDPSIVLDETDSNFMYTCVEYLYQTSSEVFSKQASDMIKLAGKILNSVYMSKHFNWVEGVQNATKRIYLITCGFNSYLESKGLALTI